MLPSARAASAQTEIGNRPSKCRSRSMPMPKGSRIAATSLSDQEPSSGYTGAIGDPEHRRIALPGLRVLETRNCDQDHLFGLGGRSALQHHVNKVVAHAAPLFPEKNGIGLVRT